MNFIENWGLLLISIIIILAYSGLVLQQDGSEKLNIWVNLLFILLNLLAAFYISRQVSMWGWLNENSVNQKKIAKTAIRHNRVNLISVIKLIRITNEKINLVEDYLLKQYLKEIKNHLEIIYIGIKSLEGDFNEIVNEELKEQDFLEVEITELLDEIERSHTELKDMESLQKMDKAMIQSLRETIKEKENQLSQKVSNLPFGTTSYLSGSALDFLNGTNLFNLSKTQNKLDLSKLSLGTKIVSK
jgi:hypothetical protein